MDHDYKALEDEPTPAVQFENDEPAVQFVPDAKEKETSSDDEDDADESANWQRNLQNLKNLHKAGVLSDASYENRRQQLINQITGTVGTTVSRTTVNRTNTGSMASSSFAAPVVVSKQPPCFDDMEVENANKIFYDITQRKWISQPVQIKLDTVPFAQGRLRLAYHVQILDENGIGQNTTYVAKISMDPRDLENREIYFTDVEMQTMAKFYCTKFNSCNVPKKVDFIMAWLLELVDRENSPLCGVEQFISGSYRKHNNNYGFVSSDERNTPQAFSHFTYASSDGKILICDIQGVSDLYTDPQIHSHDGKGFGKGNLGMRGINRFLETHRCNNICKYLGLERTNDADYRLVGTTPQEGAKMEADLPVVSIQQFPKLSERVIEHRKQEESGGSCCVLL